MSTPKISSPPLSRSTGFAHIERYYRSGLRPRRYCLQHGISEWQFYYWRKHYLSAHPLIVSIGSSEKSSQLEAKNGFHPVRIESPPVLQICGLEIHYPHGVRVIFGNEQPIGIETLSELIKLRV